MQTLTPLTMAHEDLNNITQANFISEKEHDITKPHIKTLNNETQFKQSRLNVFHCFR